MGKKHKNICVFGIVQGVGFRYSASCYARALGLKGSVKNLSNGSLKIEVEGSKFQLDTFIKWCHQGPPNARVYNIEITESELKNYSCFDVVF